MAKTDKAEIFYPKVNIEWCKGCSICVHLCPRNSLSLDMHDKAYLQNREKCIGCGLCELICPDMAIEMEPIGQGNTNE